METYFSYNTLSNNQTYKLHLYLSPPSSFYQLKHIEPYTDNLWVFFALFFSFHKKAILFDSIGYNKPAGSDLPYFGVDFIY